MVVDHTHTHPLIAKLDSIFTLTPEERQAILDMPVHVHELRARQDIVREGDRPSRSFVVLEGFTCMFKLTPKGERQIMAFHIPGDIPDLQSLHLKVLDNSVGTITRCKVGFIQHETLRELCQTYPRIGSALWRETLIDAAIFREWMIGIGRRDAFARLSHLLCEMLVRMRAVELAQDHSCKLPITQGEFGDALGLSTVHVNRTLQEIRKARLITFKGDTLKVLDWDGLRKAGEFDPTYLHLEKPQAAA
jgi:CRP-like cAMP-binding protein